MLYENWKCIRERRLFIGTEGGRLRWMKGKSKVRRSTRRVEDFLLIPETLNLIWKTYVTGREQLMMMEEEISIQIAFAVC